MRLSCAIPSTRHHELSRHQYLTQSRNFAPPTTSPANPTTSHPTRWSENQFRFTSLPSPPIGPSDAPLEEYSSFLAPLASFRLDGDDEAPASPTAASAPGPSSSSSAAPLTPARREGSAHAMDVLVQSAFDEMDSALASAHDQRDPASGASTTDASPQCWHEYRGGGGMEPNDEEQEWLDRMCDAADRRAARAAAAAAAGHLSPEEESWVQAQLHSVQQQQQSSVQESWVQQQVHVYPELEAEEARWLYSACPPDDDEMNCG